MVDPWSEESEEDNDPELPPFNLEVSSKPKEIVKKEKKEVIVIPDDNQETSNDIDVRGTAFYWYKFSYIHVTMYSYDIRFLQSLLGNQENRECGSPTPPPMSPLTPTKE